MQNKGFVKVFAVLLTLVCLFYLSFSFVTNRYNKKAAEYAGGDPVKESLYLDSLSTEKVWLGYTLKECREMEISLGLDLKGGMNVVLELSVPDVIRSLANNNPDENFNKALDLAYADQATSQRNFIDLFADEYKALSGNARLASIFSTFELKDKITPQSSDAEVVSVLKDELQSAIDNSFNVLRTRIDRFGVVSPNIQRLETAGRILVELPGVKEPERVRKLLQGSANLEFWETYKLPEIYQQLVAADAALANVLAANQVDSVATAPVEAAEEVASAEAPASETDSLLAKIQDTPEAAEQNQSAEEFAKQHPLFALLQINQYNGQLAPSAVVGYARATDMAKITEYLNMKQVKDALPRNLSLKWGVKAMDEKGMFFELYALKVTNRDGSPALGGDVVTDANADFNQQPGRTEQVVSMEMNAEGAKAWARLTKDNIGRSIAIVLDDMVYSAPNVQTEITGGQSSITGNFTPEEAKDGWKLLWDGKTTEGWRGALTFPRIYSVKNNHLYSYPVPAAEASYKEKIIDKKMVISREYSKIAEAADVFHLSLSLDPGCGDMPSLETGIYEDGQTNLRLLVDFRKLEAVLLEAKENGDIIRFFSAQIPQGKFSIDIFADRASTEIYFNKGFSSFSINAYRIDGFTGPWLRTLSGEMEVDVKLFI